jgi:hypothetical protein
MRVEQPPPTAMSRKPHRKHLPREFWFALVALAALFASAVLAAGSAAPDDYRIAVESLHAELSASLAAPEPD